MVSFDDLLQAAKEGRKIKVETQAPTLTKKEAIKRLQGMIVLYYGGPSGHGLRDARYEFDFSKNEWKKELETFPSSGETGEIPEELAKRFFDTVWPIYNLAPLSVYRTESERYVPTSDEERYIFQSDTKRLTWFRALISGKMFEWVAETDVVEPYCILTVAFTELLVGLGI